MGNPLWVSGCKSPNAGGRPRIVNSSRTVKGMVERFIKKNVTPNKLQKMYDGLTANQQLEMLLQLVPYVIAKVQADSLTTHEIDELYKKLENVVKDATAAKKAS